jgi:hypothetical protein
VSEYQLLTIDSRSATFRSGSSCYFPRPAPDATGWKVTATCSSQRMGTWSSNIKFSVHDEVLTWTSEMGTASYFRCRPSKTADSDQSTSPEAP